MHHIAFDRIAVHILTTLLQRIQKGEWELQGLGQQPIIRTSLLGSVVTSVTLFFLVIGFLVCFLLRHT
jgi:hypothetical protein